MKKLSKNIAVVLVLGLVLTVFLGGCSTDGEKGKGAGSKRISLKLNASDVGSTGHSTSTLIASVLNKNLPEEYNYTVTVHPYPGPDPAMKAAMVGDGDISLTADVGMRQFYDRVGTYKEFKPTDEELVHTFYYYPMESFMTVYTPLADNYKSWKDFNGKPVFYTPAGYMNWLNWERTFNALEYEMNHIEVDSSVVADAMESGTVVGSATYTTAGIAFAPWWKETEMRADVTVVNPDEKEIQKLNNAGLSTLSIDPGKVFSQDVGVDEIIAVPILFGLNAKADISADFIYTMLKVLEENAQSLASSDPSLKPLSEDFVGMQTAGIKANPDIPVHPGLAQYLEEKGVWDDGWTVVEQ